MQAPGSASTPRPAALCLNGRTSSPPCLGTLKQWQAGLTCGRIVALHGRSLDSHQRIDGHALRVLWQGGQLRAVKVHRSRGSGRKDQAAVQACKCAGLHILAGVHSSSCGV